MPHKVLPKLPLQTSFEVRPWASHALKSRGANVALPAVAAFALADLLSRRGLERPCGTLVVGHERRRTARVRTLVVAAALITSVLAAGCGGGGDGYAEEDVADFLNTCTSFIGRQDCRCALDNLQKENVSPEEFQQFLTTLRTGRGELSDDLNRKIVDAFEPCGKSDFEAPETVPSGTATSLEAEDVLHAETFRAQQVLSNKSAFYASLSLRKQRALDELQYLLFTGSGITPKEVARMRELLKILDSG
jgi:hypothetical protein